MDSEKVIDTAPGDHCLPSPSPLLLRAKAAALLCDMSLRTWRTWDVAGKIPQPIRIGRSLRWRASELQAWIAAGCPDRSTWQAMQN
jgi:predicted DNA-binding transcriptional regulator AlpA